jgi:hypothetical protein
LIARMVGAGPKYGIEFVGADANQTTAVAQS